MGKNSVVISVLADTKNLGKDLAATEGMFGKLSKGAAVVGVAVAAVATAVGVKAVKSASDLQQAMGGLESVFKDNAAQMENFANKAASSVGLAKSEYASLATVLGSQLRNMGVSTDQLAGQTNNLIGLGADLSAMFGGTTSDAVSALSSLLRGERDPIERYGVSINQAAIDAQLAAMGLKGLTGEAAKNAQLQATLALLYKQTADAQGQFSRESDTLAGAQQRLAAGTENLYATLGTALLPAVTAVVSAFGFLINKVQESAIFQAFTGWLTNASNAFADFLYNIMNGTGSLDFGSMFSGLLNGVVSGITNAANWLASGGAAMLVNGFVSGRAALFDAALSVFPAILDALIRAIPAIIAGLVSLVTQLATMLVTQAPIILNGAAMLFQGLIDGLVQILPGILTTLISLLPMLVTSLLSMVPTLLMTAVNLFTTLVEAIPQILPPLIAAIVEILPKLVETILNMIPAILDGAISLFTALVNAIPVILPLLITAIIDLAPKLITTIIGMIPKILEAAIRLFTGIVEAIPKILPKLIPALLNLLPQIIGALVGMIPSLVSAGVNLIGGLVQGIFKAAGSVGKALLDIAKNAVKGFLSFFGIKSPSRLFMGFGEYIDAGLAKGLLSGTGVITKAMAGVNSAVTDSFDATLSAKDVRANLYASGGSSSGSQGNVTINVQTLKADAEAGRAIAESWNAYVKSGGRQKVVFT